MSNLTIPKSGALAVERARDLLASARRVDEVKQIRDVAAAMLVYSRAQKAGREAVLDAGEIVFRADVRMGELARELPKMPGPGRGNKTSPKNGLLSSKSVALDDIGVSKQRAAEYERAARLPTKELDAYVAAERKAQRVPSVNSALKLSKLPEETRRRALTKVASGADVRRAINEVRLDDKHKAADDIRANPLKTPDGRYQVIVVDPPWKYDARAEDATHRGRNPYPDMSIEEICALPVAKLAQKNCVLWLWTTNAFMREAYQCLDAWGFEAKTILTWVKDRIGLGDWLRNRTEHCILAVRGKPLVQLKNQSTVLEAPRRAHSNKPEGFYVLLESLCPGSKLELFSRKARDGWDAWGNEI